MHESKVQGIVELRPSVFDECPDYATLGLRAAGGRFYEVFLPSAVVARDSAQFQIGQRLTLRGGGSHTEPSIDGIGEYVRWWPAEIQKDVSPGRQA